MKITDRPDNDASCNNCSHRFGDHYKTMDGRVGCSTTVKSGFSCVCNSFTTVVVHLQ